MSEPCVHPQHPEMSRLGLLAAAFSDGRVGVYALPHPGALRRAKAAQVKGRKSHSTEQGVPALLHPCQGGTASPGLGTLSTGAGCAQPGGCMVGNGPP